MMIVPALVTRVLYNAYGDCFTVEATAIKRGDHLPPAESLPLIRVRPRAASWTANGRMIQRLTIVTFAQDNEPPMPNHRDLIDRWGYVLPDYLAGLPGVVMELRSTDKATIRANRPECPSYSAVYWSAAVALGAGQ
ncbi:hypothetical protein GA0070609_4430 [Micromonospora echinaurantiaca]|uniref:Uncharacterized protein n=1 Tax=Micromonospora echinaurantiaca TaxID=47857 RepID=A0A1C5JGD4_9ACTN|nr:hypothetical protein [Micromonospora echinaurantiaca]SCG69625.1 hypothetical protein GA0070609_4430 [Micromonospora echinaurantiaca]